MGALIRTIDFYPTKDILKIMESRHFPIVHSNDNQASFNWPAVSAGLVISAGLLAEQYAVNHDELTGEASLGLLVGAVVAALLRKRHG